MEDWGSRGLGMREMQRAAWVALTLTPGMGPTRIGRAVQRLGSAARIFDAPLTELEGAGMPGHSAQYIFTGSARRAAEDEMRRVEEVGGAILTFDDEQYPDRLRQIFDPPAVLWMRGDAEVLGRPGIAVVGTRHPTPYGSGMAEKLSHDLAMRRLLILSGMARGVDTCAHKGAIEARGTTVAVWGTGIDVIYPKENKLLAERIVATGGAILSEYPLGTFPAPQNFPIRNRILSGMSVGVLVIEAGENSGTRITARCAMEQNRDVYAVPGNVTTRNAWGPNTLIKQGAKLTATWEDVWEDLPSQIRLVLEDELAEGESNRPQGASLLLKGILGDAEMPEQERLVLGRLRQDESVQLDELMEGLDGTLASPEIFTALFELELSGKVRQLPGKHYVRAM